MGNTAPGRRADRCIPQELGRGARNLEGIDRAGTRLADWSLHRDTSTVGYAVCCGQRRQSWCPWVLWATLLRLDHTLNTACSQLPTAKHTSFPSTPHNAFWCMNTGHVSAFETDIIFAVAQAGNLEPERPRLLQRTLEHGPAHSSMCLFLQNRKESESGRIQLPSSSQNLTPFANSPGSLRRATFRFPLMAPLIH